MDDIDDFFPQPIIFHSTAIGFAQKKNRPILELSFYNTEFYTQAPLMPTLHQTHLQYL